MRFVIQGEIEVDPVEFTAKSMEINFDDSGEVRIGTLPFRLLLESELARLLMSGISDGSSVITPGACSAQLRDAEGDEYPPFTLGEEPVRRPDGSLPPGWELA